MYEAVDVGTEFSNTTGFKESLIGRATFGLFRMVKNGINAVRLEYFKRKLENEYFAGVLRYCKSKNIDLKNPQPPTPSTSEPETTDVNEMEEIANGILQIRYDIPNCQLHLDDISTSIESGMTTISSGLTEYQDFQFLKDKLIPCVKEIDQKFLSLTSSSTTLDADLDIIKQKIAEINSITLNSTPSPYTLKYTLIDSERLILDGLVTALSATKPDIVTRVLVEGVNYDDDDESINEKVDNSSGTGLAFILGDELSTDGVGKFLKDQDVNSVEDINFKQLASIFTDQMKKEATNSVNKNAIIRIAATVAPIIYHVEKTPDKLGVNPGTGGGVTNTQTKLMKPWEQKVAKIKGEFSMFLNVDEIDPITIKGVSDFTKNPKNADDIKKDSEKLKEIDRITKIITYGKPDFNGEIIKDTGVIRIITKGGGFSAPVFKLEDSANKLYKYIGSMDFDLMTKDAETNKKLDLDPSTRSVFFNSSTRKFGTNVSFLPKIENKNGLDLVGIYFMFLGSITSPTSSGDSKSIKARIFYLYFKNGNGTAEWTSVPTSTPPYEIYSLNDNGSLTVVDPTTMKIDSVAPFTLGVGKTFEIQNGVLKDTFKYVIRHVTPKLLSFVTFQP